MAQPDDVDINEILFRPQDRNSERRTTMDIKRIGSQPWGKGPAEWFTGQYQA